jgi:hypothetical protein
MEVPPQRWILARLGRLAGTGRVGAREADRAETDYRAQDVKSHQQVITGPCHVGCRLKVPIVAIALKVMTIICRASASKEVLVRA